MIQKIEPAAAIRLLDAKKAQAVDVREPDAIAASLRRWNPPIPHGWRCSPCR